jgi:hypothetical protein
MRAARIDLERENEIGLPTAASNEAFDASLRAHDPAWGLREVEAVSEAADRAGLRVAEVIDMPANNVSVIFGRR